MNATPDNDQPRTEGTREVPTRGAPILDYSESAASARLREFLNSRIAKTLLILLGCALTAGWIASISRTVSSGVTSMRAEEALREAHGLADSGQFAAAIPSYDTALGGRLPRIEQARAYLGRGWCLMNVDRDLDAIRDFDAALTLNAGLVYAWLDRGIVFHRRREFDRAMADYTQAIALSASCVDAYRNRALIFASAGRMQEAIADMGEAIRWAPNDPRWPIRRGKMFVAVGNHSAALEDFDRALRIDFEDPEARHARAAVLAMQGE